MAKAKRDRAAYMRDYRKLRKEQGDPVPRSGPTVASLAAQVVELEAKVKRLAAEVAGMPHASTIGVIDETHVHPRAALEAVGRFGSPRPAPKGK